MKRLLSGKKTVRRFTLIELLIVIARIAILAQMLLPTLSHVKEQGKTIQCCNNLKQIGVASAIYSTNYKSFYPSSINSSYWYNLIARELGAPDGMTATNRTISCPSQVQYLAHWWDYGVNFFVHPRIDAAGKITVPSAPTHVIPSPEKAKYPSVTVSMIESRYGFDGISEIAHTSPLPTNPRGDWSSSFRHPGQSRNVSFCDGSVRNLKANSPAKGSHKATLPFVMPVKLINLNHNDYQGVY